MTRSTIATRRSRSWWPPLSRKWIPEEKPLPEDRKQKQRRRKKKSGNPDFDMRTEAYKLFGVDLTQIPGPDDAGLHAV